jgi:putative N6-adenine-specific DNA methylase
MNHEQNYFATVARGLEEIAVKELERLGATEIRPDFTGVHFQGTKELLYRVNLWGRVFFRILVPIAKVKSYNAQQLYQSIQEIDWSLYLTADMTFAINCTGKNERLNHSHFTSLQIKNAIVDLQQRQFNKRSNIDTEDPDLSIDAHLDNNRCIIAFNSSGTSLHRRGYRPAMGLAPLKETLAAALIEMTEWQADSAFLDPLCGSGSLPIEAAFKALNIAPGLYRQKFGFQTWLDFDRDLWLKLVTDAQNSQLANLNFPILGSDNSPEVIEQARINAQNCGLEKHLKFTQQELANIEPPSDRGIIICNPPYGKRIGTETELAELYKLLGDIFKQRFTGWTAYILTGNKQLSKKIGLRTAKRIPVYNGSLPCTLLKYELY